MVIKYERHPQYPESILIRKFIGTVNVQNIIDSWEHLNKENIIDENIKGIINDLEGCDLQMSFSSFETLISYLKKHNFIKKVKLAVVCDTPEKIIFPLMGEKRETELKIKPFSTIEAAVNWISKNAQINTS